MVASTVFISDEAARARGLLREGPLVSVMSVGLSVCAYVSEYGRTAFSEWASYIRPICRTSGRKPLKGMLAAKSIEEKQKTAAPHPGRWLVADDPGDH